MPKEFHDQSAKNESPNTFAATVDQHADIENLPVKTVFFLIALMPALTGYSQLAKVISAYRYYEDFNNNKDNGFSYFENF